MAGTRPKHYVRRFPSAGSTYAGREYDRGQAIELGGHTNDPKLLTYGYVAEWPKGTEPVVCGECGAQFVEEQFRRQHGDKRHRRRFDELPPEQADAELDATEQRLNREVPYTVPSDKPVEVTTGV